MADRRTAPMTMALHDDGFAAWATPQGLASSPLT
jgi:hypothetical protein